MEIENNEIFASNEENDAYLDEIINLSEEEIDQYHKNKFNQAYDKLLSKKDENACVIKTKAKHDEFHDEIKSAVAVSGEKRPRKATKEEEAAFRRRAYLRKKFAILNVDGQEFIIDKKNANLPKPPVYIYREILYESIKKEHKPLGDVGRDRTHVRCAEVYANVTIEAVNLLLKYCIECIKKKRKNTTNIPVTKPIRSSDYLSRVQIDLIDCQAYPDGEYKFILNIQATLQNSFT
jgi:hypothetical protein